MATILAANTGNWSATSTWTGGVVPAAGDIVVANNKVITMDTLNVTVAELRNDTTGGATANGYFNCVNGNNINTNVYAGSGSNACVVWSGTAGQTVAITGNFYGGTNGSVFGSAVYCSGGNLVIGGGSSATGGTGSGQSCGIYFNSAGTLTFATAGNPGSITGGTSSNISARGLLCDQTNSTVNIFVSTISGSATGGGRGISFSGTNQTVTIAATSIGVANSLVTAIECSGASASHTYTVSGNIVGGSGANIYGVLVNNTGTYSFTVGGSINGGSGSSAQGISINGSAGTTVNVTGSITNGASVSNATNYSIRNILTATVNVSGTVTAGAFQHTIENAATGIVRCTRAKGNGYGAGSAGINNVQAVLSAAQGSLTYIEELEFGSLGNTPVTGPIRLTAVTTNKAIFATTTGNTKTLVDTAATSGVLPAATDVRTGVVYSSGNLTGTCAVPAAGSVALGVAVDNTTGTAVLTAANARTALGLASANLDTQLSGISTSVSALPSAATIASTVWNTLTSGLSTASSIGKLLVDNVNTTISSRLASASYSAAPSAADVRTELDANSTKLANLDAAVSSRLATSAYTAPPSAATIATAVWAAATRTLTTAIDNSATIAAAVWSYATGRTITGGTVDTLTNAPTVPSAAAIASQVRTELTTELGRIDASVSSRLAASSYTTPPTAAAITSAVWAAADKTGYSLTSAERTAIATAVEQSILNESDGQQVLNAIVGAIGNTNVDQVALVAAIRADLERAGGTLATRLATASYTTPPTAAANATAVRTELATELGRIDTTVSSRLAPSGTLSRVTLTDTTTTLTNAPNVPSASTIASQVRTELTPELARMANAATVDTTGQQIQDAVTN